MNKYLVIITYENIKAHYLFEAENKSQVIDKIYNFHLFGNAIDSIEIKEQIETQMGVWFLYSINPNLERERLLNVIY